jgi:hypothetical protein
LSGWERDQSLGWRSGHLGEELVHTLRGDGHEVVGLDILPSPCTTVVGSITDRRIVRKALDGVAGVLHTAALQKPHIGSHDRQAFVDTNVTGTLVLIEEASISGVRSLHDSMGPTGVNVITKFRPLQFILYLCKPKLVIDHDQPIVAGWGTTFVPLGPGEHTICCYFRYFYLSRAMDRRRLSTSVPVKSSSCSGRLDGSSSYPENGPSLLRAKNRPRDEPKR